MALLLCDMKNKTSPKERMDRLRDALRDHRNPNDKALLTKLERCGVDWNGRYRCRTPACHRCRRINRQQQERESVRLLGGLENADLAFVTVVLGATTDINGIGAIIAKSRQDTINRFAAARRYDERWHGTYLRAWHEIDAVGAEHMPLLPPKRRGLVPSLGPMPADSLTPMWVPTWHGIMMLDDLSVEEVTGEFRRQWQLDYQVDVRPVTAHKAVHENLSGISAYANKHHTTVSLAEKQTDPWPVHWEAQYFGWLTSAQRNPFEALRMTINQFSPKAENEVCKAVESLTPMPFIHSSTGLPMSYSTGAWA